VGDRNTASADHRDIPVTLNPGSYTLSAITHGGTALAAGTDYTVSGNTYTIKKEYLAALNTGAQAITFDMSGGVDPVLAVTVTDTAPPPYPVIRHFGTWTGGNVSIGSIDGPFGDFVRLIRLDNNTVVAPSNYTVTSGSTVITLHESYLKTFANGPYAFRAEFTNGYADLTLTVNAGAGDSGSNNAIAATGVPPTGDDGSSLDVWIALCVAAGAGIAGILLWRRRRQTKEPR
jgi:LPXTG-motif cell wall-anchored protein